MKSRSLLNLLLACTTALFVGCEKITEADKTAAVETVRANLEAMKTRNADALSETVHPSSPNFEETKSAAQRQAERYTLLYDLKSAEFDSIKGGEIRVRFVQETRKVLGPDDLKDNRVTGLHTLRRDGTKWKLWGTQVQKVEELGPMAGPQ
jgi:hypothetical protein